MLPQLRLENVMVDSTADLINLDYALSEAMTIYGQNFAAT